MSTWISAFAGMVRQDAGIVHGGWLRRAGGGRDDRVRVHAPAQGCFSGSCPQTPAKGRALWKRYKRRYFEVEWLFIGVGCSTRQDGGAHTPIAAEICERTAVSTWISALAGMVRQRRYFHPNRRRTPGGTVIAAIGRV